MSHEKLQELTGFQHWLATNYKTLPADSGEMTKRARLYYDYLKDLLPNELKCVSNPDGLPYIKEGGIYKVIDEHPTRIEYVELLGEGNTMAFYKKCWFEKQNKKNE